MRLLILLLLLFIIIFIGGCIGTEPLVLTPPKMIEQQPSLNVYGKLLDYIQDDLTTFKIQSEIVNYELNNTFLEILANTTNTQNLTKKIFIDNLENLEIGKYYAINNENFGTYNGTYTDDMGEEYIWMIGYGSGYLIRLKDFKNATYIVHTPVSELKKNENYVFYFYKTDKNAPWSLLEVSENLTNYKERGSFQHDNDLGRDQRTYIEEESEGELEPGEMRAGRIFPTYIVPEGATEIQINLINKQDNDIKYLIKDVKIADEIILQSFKPNWEMPSYEERLKDSIIETCEVKYDSQENIIAAKSTKELTFEINCRDIECRKWYISKDIHGNNTGNVTTDCQLTLWGQIEFVDELGNKHIIPELGLIKQMLTTGERTNLTVEYNKEITSKEEFFIYADYRDNEGNVINNAQIELKILGVEGIFSLRYDDSLGKYKFLWSSFYEHAPPFNKGVYQFTVTALKTGYEMKRVGPYTFNII